jgi:UDP-N-acetylglucosamine 4,6-dehydratase/5-epimerase
MRYLIFGGTGTLGQATTRALLLKPETKRILVISRDELKQKQMAQTFGHDVRLKFKIADIRNRAALDRINCYHDVAFHFAALKHVDVAEDNIEECVDTNINGSFNVADYCEKNGVPNCVFSSTDKAVDPVNVYGNCKAIAERMFFRRNELQSMTRFAVYRWGNVFGSRGSAIQSFVQTLKKTGKVHVTDIEMTRFWIRIEDAVDFMLRTYPEEAPLLSPAIPPIKAASLVRVIRAVADAIGVQKYDIDLTGVRKGEKLHERLLSELTDPGVNSRDADQYTDAELAALVKESLACQS